MVKEVVLKQSQPNQGTQVLRLLNRQRVVHLLRSSGPMARADLADRLGLARSSMTAIVGELLADGTLIELASRAEEPGYRGRPRILLSCDPDARRVLGIQIDDVRARVIMADAVGTVIGQDQTPTAKRSSASVLRSIIRIANKLMNDPTGGPVAAAGICIPGFVDGPSGVVVESNGLGWSNVQLGGSIARALGVPTVVQETTQAITIAEAIAGGARAVRSAVVLTYGGTVGVGLVIDGRPYAGGTGVAGAIGHIPVLGIPTTCRCGRIGCVDAHMSMHAMQAAAPQTVGMALDDLDVDAVAGEAQRNPGAQRIVCEVIDRIAHTATLIEALLDPEVLILGGLIIEFGELAVALETRINELRPPERQGRTTTVRSQIGRDAAISVLVALEQLDPYIAGLLRTPDR